MNSKIIIGLILIMNATLSLIGHIYLQEIGQEIETKCYDNHDNEIKDLVCYENEYAEDLFILGICLILFFLVGLLFVYMGVDDLYQK